MKKIINQLFKFGIVGGIAFVIDYGLLYLLTEKIGIYYLVSSLISFSVSVIFNYIAVSKFYVISRLWKLFLFLNRML